MLFFAFRGRDAFFVRKPMEITAYSAYWHKASLSRTRETAKRTALRTKADAVVGRVIRASDTLYCECHRRDNRHKSQPAHEDQAYTHFSISKQNYSGLRSRAAVIAGNAAHQVQTARQDSWIAICDSAIIRLFLHTRAAARLGGRRVPGSGFWLLGLGLLRFAVASFLAFGHDRLLGWHMIDRMLQWTAAWYYSSEQFGLI
jgi:hypothetical protein